jgi:hypothetical protein
VGYWTTRDRTSRNSSRSSFSVSRPNARLRLRLKKFSKSQIRWLKRGSLVRRPPKLSLLETLTKSDSKDELYATACARCTHSSIIVLAAEKLSANKKVKDLVCSVAIGSTGKQSMTLTSSAKKTITQAGVTSPSNTRLHFSIVTSCWISTKTRQKG